ncbi:MAG TPA: HNH endonuclease, partial [Streptosporangiaceae bacterium]|nr:HNH endonuclease [Streptosporangiaceae bacterium]
VRQIHLERVSFDTHALSAGTDLEGVEYQQGTLAGYEVRQYLLEKWGRACAYCGREGLPLQVEHIHPRARGGSDRISNLTLACERCNLAKNSTPITEFLAAKPALEDHTMVTARIETMSRRQRSHWPRTTSGSTRSMPCCGRSSTGCPRGSTVPGPPIGSGRTGSASRWWWVRGAGVPGGG